MEKEMGRWSEGAARSAAEEAAAANAGMGVNPPDGNAGTRGDDHDGADDGGGMGKRWVMVFILVWLWVLVLVVVLVVVAYDDLFPW